MSVIHLLGTLYISNYFRNIPFINIYNFFQRYFIVSLLESQLSYTHVSLIHSVYIHTHINIRIHTYTNRHIFSIYNIYLHIKTPIIYIRKNQFFMAFDLLQKIRFSYKTCRVLWKFKLKISWLRDRCLRNCYRNLKFKMADPT